MAQCCSLDGCNLPAHFDPVTGIVHDYCGRSHAAMALAERQAELRPPHGQCHVCRYPGCDRAVYFEEATGRVHEFCGETHARLAIERGHWPVSNRSRQGEGGARACCLPGCSAARYADPATGRVHDYCGRTHARLAQSRGLLSPSLAGGEEEFVSKIFRGRGGQYAIKVLARNHPKSETVIRQFEASWKHETPTPSVVRVLQVRNSRELFLRYRNYAERHPPVVRLWHGTSLACDFGIDPNQKPCDQDTCAVCGILAESFDLAKAGTSSVGGRRMRLRYGHGLYFSKCSSKSNDYAATSERTSRDGSALRCLFLCKVALGRVYETDGDSIDDVSSVLDAGYDSIHGNSADHGGSLNYEETVVYDQTAAIPSYLVVYRLP